MHLLGFLVQRAVVVGMVAIEIIICKAFTGNSIVQLFCKKILVLNQ